MIWSTDGFLVLYAMQPDIGIARSTPLRAGKPGE
jgi:hypothetical protein